MHLILFADLSLKILQEKYYKTQNKRAQRALGRSPEEKVNGHSEDNNKEP